MAERLSNRLHDLRAERELTQAALAELVGVSRKTINTVENGVFVPSTMLALKLASLARILQDWHEEVAQAFQLHPASSPRRPLSSQSVNATNVKHGNPEPNDSIAAAKLLGHYAALQPHEQ